MSLPPYQTTRSRRADRERLAEWFPERTLDDVLSEEHGPCAPAGLRYDEPPVAPEPGDVMLLRPGTAGGPPVYVLIVAPDGDSAWRVVPFGRYAVPAVPGEWATQISATPLRVLCFWNERTVSSRVFLGGAVRRLAARPWRDAEQVRAHVIINEPIDVRLANRLGPPLVHPADPRYAYLDEERSRLGEYEADESSSGVIKEEGCCWLLAAEGRPGYGRGG